MLYKEFEIGDLTTKEVDYILKTKPFHKKVDPKGKVVMDCGGFFGANAWRFVSAGAKHVISYEAAPKNYELLRQNGSKFGFEAVYAKLVSHDRKMDHLALHPKFAASNSGVIISKKSSSVEVPCLNFCKELLRVSPHILVMDCEGAEYDLLSGLKVPGFLQWVVVEFHQTAKNQILFEQIVGDVFKPFTLIHKINNGSSFSKADNRIYTWKR